MDAWTLGLIVMTAVNAVLTVAGLAFASNGLPGTIGPVLVMFAISWALMAGSWALQIL